ncbi:MAG: helix-turn-helix domain-containing protein [Clostridia bacterium]|nr:helix-turn-helix domain-containing protein [Clostridia bacterium]
MKFAKKIKMLCIECGNISEAELARRLGVTPQTFNKKMHTDNFSVRDLEEIAAALNVKFEANFILPDGRKM